MSVGGFSYFAYMQHSTCVCFFVRWHAACKSATILLLCLLDGKAVPSDAESILL